ncbi:MAG: Rrf2 family transcriptional regulator [Desulfobacula sp.]|nr:Rrf2 family transcriptional regulator [Desulfobacula sp.]
MKLSTKTRYGTRILIDLALKINQGAIQVSQISSSQNISVKYLEQILRTLKQAGYVKSVRGPKGGHLLAKNPDTIFLGQIVRLFEGQADLVACASSPENCEMAADCLVRNAWQEATSVLYKNLDNISIANLINCDGKNNQGTVCMSR